MNLGDLSLHGIGNIGGATGIIRSIQQGTFTIGSTSTSIDASISSVDVDNTVVILSVEALSNTTDTPSKFNCAGVLTGDDNLNISRWSTGGALEGYWQVVEFKPNVHVQKGIAQDFPELTVNISTVDLTKSILLFSSKSAAAGSHVSNLAHFHINGQFNTDSQLSFNWFDGIEREAYISWFVLEFP